MTIITSLSEEDIFHYEEIAKRKLTISELKIIALLSNNGVRLDKYFLNPIIRKEEFAIIGKNDNPEIIVDKNGGEKTLRRIKDLNYNKKATN